MCTFGTNQIAIIGGFIDKKITSTCEIIDLQNLKIYRIADLNFPCYDMSVCNYDNEYIYKFGGMDS